MATDATGQLLWCTPKAKQLLTELFPANADGGPSLPSSIVRQLTGLRQPGGPTGSRTIIDIAGRKLELTFLSSTGPDELLFRLTENSTVPDEQLLQQTLALTTRESQVLLWISRGKSNREIGEILDISPRTVNKHLEQVFVKLGVENRAAAAARAVTLPHAMTARARQPTLYIPHGGGPCFFMDWPGPSPNPWTSLAQWLRSLSASLPDEPSAVLVVSGHWESDPVAVNMQTQPPLLFDYYGFPEHTYRLKYPALGDSAACGRDPYATRQRRNFPAHRRVSAVWTMVYSSPFC